MTEEKIIQKLIRSSAWASGFRANQAGIARDANLFADGSLARRHWLNGWDVAAKSKPA